MNHIKNITLVYGDHDNTFALWVGREQLGKVSAEGKTTLQALRAIILEGDDE